LAEEFDLSRVICPLHELADPGSRGFTLGPAAGFRDTILESSIPASAQAPILFCILAHCRRHLL